MLNSELKKMSIFKPEGEFSPEFKFSDYNLVKDENHMVIDIKWNDFILNKTAEEVYQEYLNPPPPQPTVEDFNLEMDYRVTMLEMLGGI